MQSVRRAVWRGLVEQRARITAAFPSISIIGYNVELLAPRSSSRFVHIRFRDHIDVPKGVKGEEWRKKPARRIKRKSYSPYTIKRSRYFSRVALARKREEFAKAEAEFEAAQAAAKERKSRSGRSGYDPREIVPNQSTSAMVPVVETKSLGGSEYYKPVVKKLDPYRAKWTPPYKKPRQNYLTSPVRPLAKKLDKAVRHAKAAARAARREKKLDPRFKNRMKSKKRMEYT